MRTPIFRIERTNALPSLAVLAIAAAAFILAHSSQADEGSETAECVSSPSSVAQTLARRDDDRAGWLRSVLGTNPDESLIERARRDQVSVLSRFHAELSGHPAHDFTPEAVSTRVFLRQGPGRPSTAIRGFTGSFAFLSREFGGNGSLHGTFGGPTPLQEDIAPETGNRLDLAAQWVETSTRLAQELQLNANLFRRFYVEPSTRHPGFARLLACSHGIAPEFVCCSSIELHPIEPARAESPVELEGATTLSCLSHSAVRAFGAFSNPDSVVLSAKEYVAQHVDCGVREAREALTAPAPQTAQ